MRSTGALGSHLCAHSSEESTLAVSALCAVVLVSEKQHCWHALHLDRRSQPLLFHVALMLSCLLPFDDHGQRLTPNPCCLCSTTVFSHAQTVVICAGCSTVLCQPTGGKARLTEGCSFRKKVE